jgi:hypothetical protein
VRRISYHVCGGTDDIGAGDLLASALVRGGFTVYTIHEAREGKTGHCHRHSDEARPTTCQRWTLFVERDGHAPDEDALAQRQQQQPSGAQVHRMIWDRRRRAAA